MNRNQPTLVKDIYEIEVTLQSDYFYFQATNQSTRKRYYLNKEKESFKLGEYENVKSFYEILEAGLSPKAVKIELSSDEQYLVISWKGGNQEMRSIGLDADNIELKEDEKMETLHEKINKEKERNLIRKKLKRIIIPQMQPKIGFSKEITLDEGYDLNLLTKNKDRFWKVMLSQNYETKIDEQIKQLAKRLRQIRQLIQFKANFCQEDDLYDKTYNHLFSGIKLNKCLKQLEIWFDDLNYAKLVCFFRALVNLKTLSKIKLALQQLEQLKSHEIEVLYKTLTTFNSLTLVDIYISNQAIDDKGLDTLFSSFKHLRTLVSFHLTIWKPRINAHSINYLFTTLSQLKSLSTLDVKLYYIKELDRLTNKSLFAPLREMKALSNLNLNFCGASDLSDGDIKDLCLALKNCQALKSLYLNVSYCTNLTDESIKSIYEYINEQKTLSSLKLETEDCPKISKKAKLNFKKCLEKMNSNLQVNVPLEHFYEKGEEKRNSLYFPI